MTTSAEELREQVRARYAESARAVTGDGGGCGCGTGGCCADAAGGGNFGEALYAVDQRGELPEAAVLASLDCGNPTAVADLQEGETVLDLGSGGGIDVILSARRVGPTGTARAGLEAAGFEQVSVVLTHEGADGMHGAIVKAVKLTTPAAPGLPVVRPAAGAGCC
jgi:hypothetical protein